MRQPDDLTGRHGKNRQAARTRGRGLQRERAVEDLRRARPVARSVLRQGTVVWARIPYRDQPDTSKTRPAIVSGVEGRTVHLLPVTSSTKESVRLSPQAVCLADWAAAGLNRPCIVTRATVDVDIIDITTVIGALADCDQARVFR